MFCRFVASIITLIICTGMVFSQTPVPPSGGSVVSGLEIPSDQSVSFDEGFVTLQAKTKGEVKWLVTAANSKVKFIVIPTSNSIIISIPPTGGVINVYAVALVDGRLTDFAKTSITVGGTSPNPPTPPNPPIPIDGTKLHLTFLVDMNSVTPELAKMLNSESLRKGINQKGHWFRLYDMKSPIVAQKKLEQAVQQVGGNAVLVIQTDDGVIRKAMPIPQNEQEIFNLIQQIVGK